MFMAYPNSDEPIVYSKFKAPHKLIATTLAVTLAVTPGMQAFALEDASDSAAVTAQEQTDEQVKAAEEAAAEAAAAEAAAAEQAAAAAAEAEQAQAQAVAEASSASGVETVTTTDAAAAVATTTDSSSSKEAGSTTDASAGKTSEKASETSSDASSSTSGAKKNDSSADKGADNTKDSQSSKDNTSSSDTTTDKDSTAADDDASAADESKDNQGETNADGDGESKDAQESNDAQESKSDEGSNSTQESQNTNQAEEPSNSGFEQGAYVSDSSSEYASSSTASTTTHKTSTVVRHVTTNLTTQKFIAVIGEQARDVASENGLYASVMIAQAILESASGNSTLAAAPNNNLFGIKGSYNGNSVNMSTQEDDGTGAKYTILAGFRKYDNIRESLEDYADLLTNQMGSYYVGALKANAETYADACDFLQGRYATDTTYSSQLQSLIVSYGLTKYDEPLSYEEKETYTVKKTDEDGNAVTDSEGKEIYEERTLADLVTEVTSHMGEDYVWGGSECGSFDCSGLVQHSYEHALGITLPRVAEDQSKVGEEVTLITEDELLEQKNVSTEGQSLEEAAETRKAQLVEVDFDALHMGDLLYFEDSSRGVYHVAMYLGEGCYIHAPQAGDVVKVSSLAEWEPSFAMRVVEVKEADTPTVQEEPKVAEEPAVTTTVAAEPEPAKELSLIEKAKLLAARTISTYRETLDNINEQ